MRAASQVLRTEPDASIEDIAEAAGVSRATVYRHFKNRDDLVRLVREQSGALVDLSLIHI